MSTLSISRTEATRRFVQFAARYAIKHHVGWLLDAGVELGIITEEVDINGNLGVQLMPWVDSTEQPTKRVRKRVCPQAKRGGHRRRPKKVDTGGHAQEMSTVSTPDPGTNVFPIRKVDIIEVDRLRGAGKTHKEIAVHLGVSTKTVQRMLRQGA
jgi:hypothetical protein